MRNKKGQFIKGNIPKYTKGFLGKKHTEKTKKKMSIAISKPKIKKVCPQCGKEFEVSPSQNTTIYCSRDCFGKSHKGKPTWNKGKRGVQAAWNKGKRFFQISGKNHYNWKGGISTINDKARHNLEMNLWKKAVLERDNFTCQKYNIKGGKLNAHHINNFSEFPELRTAIDNGITLSEKAHKEFHKKYGKKNNTKEQLEEFLNQNKWIKFFEKLFKNNWKNLVLVGGIMLSSYLTNGLASVVLPFIFFKGDTFGYESSAWAMSAYILS